jgi:hypothetical protein
MNEHEQAHQDARHEARHLIEQIVSVLHEGEHLGPPHRSNAQIVIPIEAASSAGVADEASKRALLATWLDAPPRAD